MFGSKNPIENPEQVSKVSELYEYLEYLISDLDNNEQAWENLSIRDYLSGIASYLSDSGAQNAKSKKLHASDVAGLFHAGKIYE